MAGDHLERCLRSSADDTWTHVDVEEGREPVPSQDALDAFDAVVISGSKHDAHSDARWVRDVGDCAAERVRRKRRVLGVCFGAQLLAHYCGGQSGPDHAYGWELGPRAVRIDRDAARPYVGDAAEVVILECHRDQILALPPGAASVGSSDRCPHEIFGIGDHCLAVQGHPEMVVATLDAIINARPDLIGAADRARCAAAFQTHAAPDPLGPSDAAALCRRFLAHSGKEPPR